MKDLKKDALKKLSDKWADAVAVVLLYGLISSVSLYFTKSFTNNKVTIEFVSFIISSLFILGYRNYFYKVSKDEDVEINELWKNNNFLVSLGITFLLTLIITCGIFFFVIPGIIIALAYSMTYYIYLDNPELSIFEAMTKSRIMMNGHKWELLGLVLSFIGWVLISPFTLFLLLFWLTPYYNVTIANYYNKIKEQ